MKALWQTLNERFLQLGGRERKWIIFGGAGAILYLGFMLWIDPAWQNLEKLDAQISNQQQQLTNLQSQVAMLSSEVTDPNATALEREQRLRKDYQQLEQEVARRTEKLISPQSMLAVLRSLLTENPGVKVVAMTSHSPREIDLSKGENGKAKSPRTNELFQRGVTLTLEGEYFDLKRYVDAVENVQWELYWQEFDYQTTDYPKARLTLSLYTLTTNDAFIGV